LFPEKVRIVPRPTSVAQRSLVLAAASLMKNKTQSSRTVPASFEGGQVWQLAQSHVQIELVGKTLVHYRHYTGLAKRPPILLSSKLALKKFLRSQRAFISEAAAICPPVAHDRAEARRKPSRMAAGEKQARTAV
jgi:hypothetical protein